MIRTFAIGLALGTQHLLLVFFIASTDYSFAKSFGPTLWLGFSINLVVAETWVNRTKPKKYRDEDYFILKFCHYLLLINLYRALASKLSMFVKQIKLEHDHGTKKILFYKVLISLEKVSGKSYSVKII